MRPVVKKKFNKYIDFAKSIMRALPAKEIPVDLTDAHILVKSCDMFDGFYDQLGEEDLRDAMGAVSGLAKLAELCRWLLKTDVRLSACFSMDMQNNVFFVDNSKADTQTALSGSGPGSGSASELDGDGSVDLWSNGPPRVAYDEVSGTGAGLGTPAPRVCRRRPLSATLAEPLPPGSISQKFAARVLPDMRLMTHVTQRPEVRGGVGELCFLSTMVYACSLQGQRKNAVGAMLRCTDILVKNPGICRSTSFVHLVHVCLNCMVVSGNAEKYEELRTLHNCVVDNDVRRAPPFEEFRGMSSICGNIFCKSVDNVFTAIAARKRKPSNLGDDTFATFEGKTRLCPPKAEDQGVDTIPYYSVASDESWAKGVFDKRRHEQGGNGKKAPAPAPKPSLTPVPLGRCSFLPRPPTAPTNPNAAPSAAGAAATGAAATSAAAPAPAGGSAASISASSRSSTDKGSTHSNSVGRVPSGEAAAVTAAPLAAAEQDGIRRLDQQARDGTIPMPLLASVPSAQASSDAAGSAEVGGDSKGDGSGGLELLRASELEAVEAAGLLDAVDSMLGEAVLEGFAHTSSEEDDAPIC